MEKQSDCFYVDVEKGTKEGYLVTVKTVEGKYYAVFETTHFSTYVLSEPKDRPGSADGRFIYL